MSTETLFSASRSLERFYDLAARAYPRAALEVKLHALDAYLLRQAISFFPQPPSVVDLAAKATHGASTLLLASHEATREVLAPGVQVESDLARVLRAGAQSLDIDDSRVRLVERDLRSPDDWSVVRLEMNCLAPPVFVVAPDAQDRFAAETLGRLCQWVEQPCVFVLGIGPPAECPRFEQARQASQERPELKLHLLRELSPFFSASQMGVLVQRDQKLWPAIAQRLKQWFDGNFDFLTLAKENIDLRFECHRRGIHPAHASRHVDRTGNMISWFASMYRHVVPGPVRRRLRLGSRIRNMV